MIELRFRIPSPLHPPLSSDPSLFVFWRPISGHLGARLPLQTLFLRALATLHQELKEWYGSSVIPGPARVIVDADARVRRPTSRNGIRPSWAFPSQRLQLL